MDQLNKPQRIVWLDLLRLIALMMVVGAHSVDLYNATPQADSSNAFWGGLIGSMMRPSVPLFAMMTGMLLLPTRGSASDFYRKRIPRVLIPMVLWSAIYYLIPWFTGLIGAEKSVILILFPFEFSPSQELGDALKNIAMIPFAFNGYTTHMWYIYMLIGLYFLMPYISAWIEKEDRTLTHTFMKLWAFSLVLPYISQLITPYIWGKCAWNEFGTLYYFAGFAGYLVLGYLLGKGSRLRSTKAVAVGIMLYISGCVVTYKGYSTMAGLYSYEQAPEMLELFWQFCSPNVVIMAIGIFMVVQRLKITSPKAQAALANVTKCGFGSYLVHYIFIGPVILTLQPLNLPTPLCVVLTVVIVMALSLGLTNLIYRIAPRWAKYIVG